MPVKYIRDRKANPVGFLSRLASDLRAEVDTSSDFRFHVISARFPDKLACNSLPLAQCRPLGAAWPCRGRFCERCRAYRPDAAILEST